MGGLRPPIRCGLARKMATSGLATHTCKRRRMLEMNGLEKKENVSHKDSQRKRRKICALFDKSNVTYLTTRDAGAMPLNAQSEVFPFGIWVLKASGPQGRRA